MFEDAGRKLSGMVKIPTVSGKGHEEEYHIEAYRKFLKKEFAEIFAVAEEIPVGEARLLRLPGNGSKGGKPVLFTGHMDVVPAVDGKAWKYPPFSGEIAEERVWGRGAQDMKGPQCALLMALDGLLKEGWRPKREVWLYLSCDEETGGETTGTAASLLRRKGISLRWYLTKAVRSVKTLWDWSKEKPPSWLSGRKDLWSTDLRPLHRAVTRPRRRSILPLSGLVR